MIARFLSEIVLTFFASSLAIISLFSNLRDGHTCNIQYVGCLSQ